MLLNKQKKQALGICVRTVYNWIKQHAWDRLRLATHQAPALIADNFSSQLVELQNSIRYDNGNTPAVTIKKGGPVKLERRAFYFR